MWGPGACQPRLKRHPACQLRHGIKAVPLAEQSGHYGCVWAAGGVRGGWDNLLALIPGGSSCPLLTKSGEARPAQASRYYLGPEQPYCTYGERVH